jgi:hypothetical protein
MKENIIQNPISNNELESEYSSPTHNSHSKIKPLMFFGEDLAIKYKNGSILGDNDSDEDDGLFKTFHSIYDYQE